MHKYQFIAISIFPHMFSAVSNFGINAKANNYDLTLLNPRDYADKIKNKHRKVDDTPFGGGPGMVMMPDILDSAVDDAQNKLSAVNIKRHRYLVVYTSCHGRILDQNLAIQLVSMYDAMIFVCGRYEGVDQRFIDHKIDLEISLGNFVLSGGELAVMTIMDSMIRLLPNTLKNHNSILQESFSSHNQYLLEHPQYTKPRKYYNIDVPDILLSGNHKEIDAWRMHQSIIATKNKLRNSNQIVCLKDLNVSNYSELQTNYCNLLNKMQINKKNIDNNNGVSNSLSSHDINLHFDIQNNHNLKLQNNLNLSNNLNFLDCSSLHNIKNNSFSTQNNTLALFIGRFQPFHYGHLHIICEMFKMHIAEYLLILIGSANIDTSTTIKNIYDSKNPFNYEERLAMIAYSQHHIKDRLHNKIFIAPIDDYATNDIKWQHNIRLLAHECVLQNNLNKIKDAKICIVGYSKDESSYYLDSFPDYQFYAISPYMVNNSNIDTVLNGADIRKFFINYGQWPMLPFII